MTKYPCRCRRCGSRRTLAKHPEAYRKEPTCSCGGTYRVDRYRRIKEHQRTTCRCLLYWFPHRRVAGCATWGG